MKKMTLKRSSPSSSDTEYVPSDTTNVESSESESAQSKDSLRGDSPPPSPHHEVPIIEYVPSPPLSPTHTTVPITIAPCLSPISTRPPLSTPLPPPIFIETTTTSTTTEPLAFVNVSDTGAPTSCVETLIISKPLSSSHSTKSETILGEEDVEFDTFHYSPFTVQRNSDDDAPITKRHLKDLNEKLNTLIASSSSSSTTAYSEIVINGLVATLFKEHESSIDKSNKAVEAST